MSRAASFGFLTLLIAFVLGQVVVGRLPAGDEVFFKAAGREWARSGVFAAPELTGFLKVDPPITEVFFAQPPLYPFSFGVFARVVGFGPTQCILFDAIIHALLSLVTFLVCRNFLSGRSSLLPLLVGASVLPLGTVARADELAMLFGMAGVYTLTSKSFRERSWISGVGFGLACATSSGAAILLGLIGLALVARRARDFRQFILEALRLGGSTALVLALALAPIFVSHPFAYRQYLAHARMYAGKGNFSDGFLFAFRYGKSYLALVAGLIAVVSLGWRRQRLLTGFRDALPFLIAPMAGLLFICLMLPEKYLYTWFIGPWLLIGAGLVLDSTWAGSARRWTWTLGLVGGIGYAIGIVPFLFRTGVMLSLPPSQTLARNVAEVTAAIPPGTGILSGDYWWLLGNRNRVYDPTFSDPPVEAVDYMILTVGGLGRIVQSSEIEQRTWKGKSFTLVRDNLNRSPVRLFGHPISHSAYGFGTAIFASRLPASPPAGTE